MSNSVRPHRWQPIRLPRPWDSPGKNYYSINSLVSFWVSEVTNLHKDFGLCQNRHLCLSFLLSHQNSYSFLQTLGLKWGLRNFFFSHPAEVTHHILKKFFLLVIKFSQVQKYLWKLNRNLRSHWLWHESAYLKV